MGVDDYFFFGKAVAPFSIVLFCLLLSIRFVSYGYREKQALLSLGIVLTILGVSPLISLISVSFYNGVFILSACWHCFLNW